MLSLHLALFDANKLTNEIENKLLEAFGEVTPELEELLSVKDMALHEVKKEVDLLAMTIERIDQLVNYYNSQIDHLEKLVKGLETSEERLRENILTVMQSHNVEAIEGLYKGIKLRTNPPKVEIIDELAVSDEFKNMKMTETLNKKAISEALKSGRELHWARLTQSKSLVINQAKPKSYQE